MRELRGGGRAPRRGALVVSCKESATRGSSRALTGRICRAWRALRPASVPANVPLLAARGLDERVAARASVQHDANLVRMMASFSVSVAAFGNVTDNRRGGPRVRFCSGACRKSVRYAVFDRPTATRYTPRRTARRGPGSRRECRFTCGCGPGAIFFVFTVCECAIGRVSGQEDRTQERGRDGSE